MAMLTVSKFDDPAGGEDRATACLTGHTRSSADRPTRRRGGRQLARRAGAPQCPISQRYATLEGSSAHARNRRLARRLFARTEDPVGRTPQKMIEIGHARRRKESAGGESGGNADGRYERLAALAWDISAEQEEPWRRLLQELSEAGRRRGGVVSPVGAWASGPVVWLVPTKPLGGGMTVVYLEASDPSGRCASLRHRRRPSTRGTAQESASSSASICRGYAGSERQVAIRLAR